MKTKHCTSHLEIARDPFELKEKINLFSFLKLLII